jgi:probable FeS assembly SUF system protein SufT
MLFHESPRGTTNGRIGGRGVSDDRETRTSREVRAIRIPSGDAVVLPPETVVVVAQSLGGSFTLLVPEYGGLFRLGGEDADAIGQSPLPTGGAADTSARSTDEAVWDALKTCYDPEIPVNIVDLGLIYSCEVRPADGGSDVSVKMTLTAPGCGMGPVLAREAEEKIVAIAGVARCRVELVWDPPWSPDRISAEGREKLGME